MARPERGRHGSLMGAGVIILAMMLHYFYTPN